MEHCQLLTTTTSSKEFHVFLRCWTIDRFGLLVKYYVCRRWWIIAFSLSHSLRMDLTIDLVQWKSWTFRRSVLFHNTLMFEFYYTRYRQLKYVQQCWNERPVPLKEAFNFIFHIQRNEFWNFMSKLFYTVKLLRNSNILLPKWYG